MGLKMLCGVLLLCVAQGIFGGHHWDYAAEGPSTWEGKCLGKAQSPINIDVPSALDAGSNAEKKVMAHNYWTEPYVDHYTLKNNGHALQIDLPSNTTYQLKKGKQTYVPLQVHIHFDPVTGKGSEHTLNGKKYFAEIHMVHRNAKYTKKEDIMSHSDGLFVIGMFVDRVKTEDFMTSDLDFSYETPDAMRANFGTSFAMQVFAQGARKCRRADKKIPIKSFPLGWLFPSVRRNGAMFDYINYKGSLTTPPCSEIVDWVVITGKTLKICEKTANLFKKVKNGGKTRMAGNNRPVQKLNGRKLYGVQGSF